MMRFIKAVSLATVVACSAVGTASAATVTAGFVIPEEESGQYADFATQTYRENGLNFDVLSGHYEISNIYRADAFHVDDSDGVPAVIAITFDDGLFDLVSFNVPSISPQGVAVFTSDLGDSFTFTAANTLGVNLFPTTFKGVRAITLFFANGEIDLDNFTIDDRATDGVGTPSPVPLPATLPLFAFALGGLGLGARRRKAVGEMA